MNNREDKAVLLLELVKILGIMYLMHGLLHVLSDETKLEHVLDAGGYVELYASNKNARRASSSSIAIPRALDCLLL